jgi:hypothetical protein
MKLGVSQKAGGALFHLYSLFINPEQEINEIFVVNQV